MLAHNIPFSHRFQFKLNFEDARQAVRSVFYHELLGSCTFLVATAVLVLGFKEMTGRVTTTTTTPRV